MQIGISRRDSGVRRNGKFFSNFYHSDVNRNLRRDSGVRRNGKFFFLIFNFYHSDVNRNLPRRRYFRRRIPALPAVIPANAGIHSGRLILEFPRIFLWKRGKFAVLFLKMDSRVRGNDGGFFSDFRRQNPARFFADSGGMCYTFGNVLF